MRRFFVYEYECMFSDFNQVHALLEKRIGIAGIHDRLWTYGRFDADLSHGAETVKTRDACYGLKVGSVGRLYQNDQLCELCPRTSTAKP